MKQFFKIGMIAVMASTMFTSCLKDTPTTDYSDKAIKPIVLVPNGNWPRTQAAAPIALDFTSTPYEVRVYARVSWDKPLSKAVEVTFKEDDAAIGAFNTKFSQNWVKMNAAAYSVPALTVTIPAGQQEAYIPVKVFPDKVDLTKFNMLAFTITGAGDQTVSSNYQTILVPILIKNIYEDDYGVTGYFFHPTAGRAINATKYFATINGTRVEGQLGDLGGWGFRVNVAGSTVSGWEATGSAASTVANGFMTLDNPGGTTFAGAPQPGVAPWLSTTYNNTYDAATQTFYLHYGYNAASGTSQNNFTRQIYEKWVRK
jgi:hypothetical protein